MKNLSTNCISPYEIIFIYQIFVVRRAHWFVFYRVTEVHEVVDAVMFLLSDKAILITGVCLPVDGGVVAS